MSNAIEVEAAQEIYETGVAERKHQEEEIAALRKDERAIGGVLMAGHLQGYSQLVKYMTLRKIKEDKEYKAQGMTWDEFCRQVGEPRRSVDRILAELDPLANRISGQLADFSGVDFNKIRRLGRAVSANLADFTEDAVIIDGQTIPFSKDHREDLEDAISKLVEKQKAESDKIKKRLQKLERRQEAIIKEETKALESERDSLKSEVNKLKLLVPEDPTGLDVKQLSKLQEAAAGFANLCRKLMAESAELKEDRFAQGQISGIMDTVDGLFTDLRTEFEAKFGMLEDI